MPPTKIDLSEMKAKWQSAIVCRDKVEDFTGGLITRGTLTNLDSKGDGPPRFYMGPRKVAYRVDSFVDWLQQRIERLSAVVPKKVDRRRKDQR
jgi:hypothetical protein